MPFTSKTFFSIISNYFTTKLKSTPALDRINSRHRVVILRQNRLHLDIFYYFRVMNYTQTFLKALLLYCQQQKVDIGELPIYANAIDRLRVSTDMLP